MQQLQAQKENLCAASTFGGLSAATQSTGNSMYMIGQLYGGVTCMAAAGAAYGMIGGGPAPGATGTAGGTEGGLSTIGEMPGMEAAPGGAASTGGTIPYPMPGNVPAGSPYGLSWVSKAVPIIKSLSDSNN